MDEQVWEGRIEIVQPDREPLPLFARLWMRNGGAGVRWGGQLELLAVDMDRLRLGPCMVRMPDGRERVATISAGATDEGMTRPNLLGKGNPPFGEHVSPAPQIGQIATPPPVSAQTPPVAPGASALPAAEATADAASAQASSSAGPAILSETEALARAFLHATDARRTFHATDRGRLGDAAASAVLAMADDLVHSIEGRLRSDGSDGASPAELRQSIAFLRRVAEVLDRASDGEALTPGLADLGDSLARMAVTPDAA